jgi:hypothetical protein
MKDESKEDAGCGCLFLLIALPFIIVLWRWALG